jgi:hypothetical protein
MKPQDDPIGTSVPNNFNLSGANLTSISQSTAYHDIRTSLTQPPNKYSTTINLDIVHHTIHRLSNISKLAISLSAPPALPALPAPPVSQLRLASAYYTSLYAFDIVCTLFVYYLYTIYTCLYTIGTFLTHLLYTLYFSHFATLFVHY